MAKDSTIRDAIRVIDEGAAQIALVVAHDGVLLGTITDGDVRRGLLGGLSLDSPASEVMCSDFTAISPGMNEQDALAVMHRKRLQQVPVVDTAGRVQKVYLLEELLTPPPLRHGVLVMAGGRGRRLLPLTSDKPKPMLHVSGRPMLEVILQRCIRAGFHQFFFSVGYLKESIKDYFGDGNQWGVSIVYLEELEPLGTAGALGLLPSSCVYPVVVVNGDVLTHVNFRRLLQFHGEHAAAATVCVKAQETELPFGVVSTDGVFLRSIREKPTLVHNVSAGIYVLGREVVSLVRKSERLDMPQLLQRVLERNSPITAFPIHEYWVDAGDPEALEKANGDWP